MDFEQQLHRALAPCEPRPELWASVLKRASFLEAQTRSKPRSGSRAILFGTVLAVAAAASMMAWLLTRSPDPRPVAVAAASLPALEPAVVAVQDSPVVESAMTEQKVMEIPAPAKLLPTVQSFTVRLLPLRNDAGDPGAKGAVEAFFDAFVDNLQSVPGLELVRADGDLNDEDSLPDFQITVVGTGQDSSGKFTVAVMGDQRTFLEMKRKFPNDGKNAGEGFGFASSIQGDINASCAPVGTDDAPECRTPATHAALLVDRLRKRTFPQDPSFKLQLKQDLLDGSLDPVKRLKALTDLGSLNTSVRGETLQDPSIVEGAIALAKSATDPAIRARVWRAMRGSRHPDLADEVIESLRQSRDAEVRLQTVILLQEDFSSDPRARQALEGVLREETRPLVRALASRALNGESYWNDYIVASLKNTSLPNADRIEAFLYDVAKPGRIQGSIEFSNIRELSGVLDDEAIGALAQLLPEAAKSSEVKSAMTSILSALGALQKPSITAMFIGMLEQAEQSLRYPIVQELARRTADPAARAALEKVSKEDPEAALRELAAKAL